MNFDLETSVKFDKNNQILPVSASEQAKIIGRALASKYKNRYAQQTIIKAKAGSDPAEAAASYSIDYSKPDEWRWAVAFRRVLGVGNNYYEFAPASRKRELEAHYRMLAQHDTPKGRRAAKVVKEMIAMTLEGRDARSRFDTGDAIHAAGWKTHRAVNDRLTAQQLFAYQHLYDPTKPSKLSGNSPTGVIVDESSELERKKP